MTDIEQKADDLVRAVYHEVFESAHTPIVLDITGSARDLILAYADEIRRECADRAVKWYNEPDSKNYLEKYDDDEYWNNALTAAIIGKEVRK